VLQRLAAALLPGVRAEGIHRRADVRLAGQITVSHVRPVKPWRGFQYWKYGVRLSDAEGERLVHSILHPRLPNG